MAVVDFAGVDVVVDVAGGNGALLGQILRAIPHLRGVLLERPHAIDAAGTTLARAGCADRCELVEGDFTSAVPQGGDVYILSRVLHDWDDQQCGAILKRCAEAMPDHADLLIIERLLPENDARSLAVAWDLHMMCNVGGRERTATHMSIRTADTVQRRTRGSTAAALIMLLFATVCTSGAPDEPTRPPITRPLDASLFADRVCDLLPNEQATRLGYPTPGYQAKAPASKHGSGRVSCYRSRPESSIMYFQLHLADDQLAYEYQGSKNKSIGGTNEPWLEPVDDRRSAGGGTWPQPPAPKPGMHRCRRVGRHAGRKSSCG